MRETVSKDVRGRRVRSLDQLAELFAADPDRGFHTRFGPPPGFVYLETPSNPLIDVIDIEAVSRLARGAGALVFTDSSFAGPLLQQPIELGADLSLQSASTSMGGHADLIAGSAAGSAELIEAHPAVSGLDAVESGDRTGAAQ